MENKEAVKIFKALGDENRLRILDIIGSSRICACKLLEYLNIGQPTLSHHMKILCESKIVDGTKDGKWIYYKINEDVYNDAAKFLQKITKKECDIKDKCDKC